MSPIKFACPVCGQHITCDASGSGTRMDCPTCFRHLIVPHPPAAGAPNLILAAAEAPNRPSSFPGPSPTLPGPPRKKGLVVAVAVGVIVLSAAGGLVIFRNKIFHSQPSPPAAAAAPVASTVVAPPLPPPAATNWTLKLADVKIPDSPASGRVSGRGFELQRATIQGGRLDLRQGVKWPPDVGVSVHLFADRAEELAGKIVVIDAARTNAPKVFLRWKDELGQPQSAEFQAGYALRVEFGAAANNHLEGKVYLATPDEPKSFVAGTFIADIRKPAKLKQTAAK